MPNVLVLTGPAGAGKSTIAQILAAKYGFVYLDGDHEDTEFFPEGNQWLPENSELLRKAHAKILRKTADLFNQGENVVIDYIIFGLYDEFFDLFSQQFGNDLAFKVLMPSVAELMKRDTERECWTTGAERIAIVSKEFISLREKIGANNFIDSTGQTSDETLRLVLQ